MKNLIALLIVAVSISACGNTVESACQNVNDVCAEAEGYKEADCEAAQNDYDDLSDEEKKQADKNVDCLAEADDCDAAIACLE